MLASPSKHRNGGGCTGIDRSGGTVLRDVAYLRTSREEFGTQSGSLRAKHQDGVSGQAPVLDGRRSRDIVNSDHGIPRLLGPFEEIGGLGVVVQVEVAIGDHGAAAIPPPSSHDVNPRDVVGVGGAHDRPNVEVVIEVFESHSERVTAAVKVGDNSLQPPVPVAVWDVSAIPVGKEYRVVVVAGRPLLRWPGPNANLARPDLVGHLLSRRLSWSQSQVVGIQHPEVGQPSLGHRLTRAGVAVHNNGARHDLRPGGAERVNRQQGGASRRGSVIKRDNAFARDVGAFTCFAMP